MDIYEAVEKMTDEEKKALLAEDLGEDLEKEAAAEVAQSELENALYAYGMFKADVEVESAEEGLSKEAQEQFEGAEKEISEAIEQGVTELGLDQLEDEAELYKVAMACAGVIFQGYATQMQKIADEAAKPGMKDKAKKMWSTVKAKAGELGAKAKAAGNSAKEVAKKHGGKAGLLAGGAALGAGAMYLKHKHMDKKASEATVGEIADVVLNKQAAIEVVADGIDKLAAWGMKEGGRAAKAMGHLKHFAKHKATTHAAAAAAGGGAGYLAHKMRHKSKE